MNLLRVITSLDPRTGGPSQGIRNLTTDLELKGVRQEVVSLDPPDAAFLGMDSFPVHPLGPGSSSWAYASNLSPWLKANLSRFDVVIQHGLWQYPGLAICRAIRNRGTRNTSPGPRWYIYPHGMLDPWFQQAKERRLKAVRNLTYWKLIENRVIEGADGLLFTTEEERRLAATTFHPYRPRAEHTIGYGVPEPPGDAGDQVAAFHDQFPFLERRPLMLFLSRIHPKKGLDLLIEAYGRLLKAGRSDLPVLVIAGPCADRAYWERLQSLAVHMGLQESKVPFPEGIEPERELSGRGNSPESRIHWVGMLTGAVKWGALRAASVFILPSHQENFGIAVAEALACETPVIITNKVNTWREIDAAGAGLVASDRVENITDILRYWLDSGEDEKGRMAARALACFSENFRAASAAERLHDLLRGSVDNVAASTPGKIGDRIDAGIQ